MPVQFRAIDRRRNPREILASFERRTDEFKRRVLSKAAESIVAFSPVDTGTYIMEHDITSGGRQRGLASVSSHGRPRGQEKSDFDGAALSKLLAAVEALPTGFSDVMLANYAAHAPQVEYLGWGSTGPYYVYTETRARMAQFIVDTEMELRF